MAHDVFISHSSRDKATADAVCATLELHRIKCWIAPRDITGGMEYGSEIIQAIKGSRVMVVIFSGWANNSKHVKREVERAVSHGVTVIPLRIEDVVPDCSLEYFIGSIHWLDALSPPLEKHLHELAQKVKLLLDRQTETNLGDSLAPVEPAPPPPRPRPGPGFTLPAWLTRDVLIGGVSAIIGLILTIFIIAELLHRHPSSKTDTASASASPTQKSGGNTASNDSESAPTSTAGPSTSAANFPSQQPKKAHNWIIDASGAADADSRDLPQVIANLSDNDTVTLRPGTYTGGVNVKKSVRIVGSSSSRDDVTIDSTATDTIRITAKGVTLENVHVTQSKSGDTHAIFCTETGSLTMSNVLVDSQSTYGAVLIKLASLKAKNCTFRTNGNGSGFQAEGNSKAELDHCTFMNNQWGVSALNSAQVKITACIVKENGLSSGKGCAISVTGAEAQMTVDDSEVTNNPATITITEGGSLTMTETTLKGNGVSGEEGNANSGLMTVSNQAVAKLTNVTADSNREGFAVVNGGSLVLVRCNLSNNGIRTDNEKLLFYAHTIAANGEGTTLTMTGCTVDKAVVQAILIDNGATAKLNDTIIRNGSYGGLTVGYNKLAASHADLDGVKFIGNHTNGLDVVAGSSVTVRSCEFTDNRTCAIAVQNFNTTATISDCSISGSAEYGVCVYNGGEATVTDTTFQDNGRAAQAGLLANAPARGTLVMRNCTISGSRICGIAVCTQANATLQGCRFSNNRSQNVWTERGAILHQNASL